MTRGKHSSASLARRYAEAEQDILDWKRQSRDQRRRIEELTAEVHLMPALRERVAVLEMQLELATCAEIATLNKTIGEQRDHIRELEATVETLQINFMKLTKHIGPKGRGNAVLEELLEVISGEKTTVNSGVPQNVARRLGAERVRRLNKLRDQ